MFYIRPSHYRRSKTCISQLRDGSCSDSHVPALQVTLPAGALLHLPRPQGLPLLLPSHPLAHL